jgi:hypothetical protein
MNAAVDAEISRRLRAQRMRGDFGAIHAAPAAPADVPDTAGARLVVLGPEHPHRDGDADSPACGRAAELLATAADGAARHYRNMLVFLAADGDRLDGLRALVGGAGTAGPQGGDAERELAARVGETWSWLLAPAPGGRFEISQAPGREDLAMRASRQLRADGALIADFPPGRLRADLDTVPLWPDDADHVALADVWEAYATSLELPRLRSSATLAAAIVGGVAAPDWETASFAYAAAWDPERQWFDGLVAGREEGFALAGSGLLVRAAAARAQLDRLAADG